jgi:hypothetical protein
MGQYRFSIYAHWQIGFLIKIDEYSLDINLPFISMHIALTKYAKGIEIFGKILK